MATIEIEGFDEFEDLLSNMDLDILDKKAAIKSGIDIIANGLEGDSPVGESGELSKIKTSVRCKDFAVEGVARSKAFYDVFQEFGTSEQKAHVGYFDRSVEKNKNEALKILSETIFNKMR